MHKDTIARRVNFSRRKICSRGLNCTKTILRGSHLYTIEENSYKKDVLIENQKENMLLTEC